MFVLFVCVDPTALSPVHVNHSVLRQDAAMAFWLVKIFLQRPRRLIAWLVFIGCVGILLTDFVNPSLPNSIWKEINLSGVAFEQFRSFQTLSGFNQSTVDWPATPQSWNATATELKVANDNIQLVCANAVADSARTFFLQEAAFDSRLEDLLHLTVGASQQNDNATTFSSLAQAFKKLRQLRFDTSLRNSSDAIQLKTKGALISVREGVYPLEDTLQLTEEDSGSFDAPIIVRGDISFKTEITGAVTISTTKCASVTDPAILKRIPLLSRSFLQQCFLPDLSHWPDLFSLRPTGFSYAVLPTAAEVFVNGKAFWRARWPNLNLKASNFTEVGEVIDIGSVTRTGETNHTGARFFLTTKHAISNWNTTDLWASGYFFYGWADDTVPVASVNKTTGEIAFGFSTHYGVKTGGRIFFFNVLEALDQPGEYVIDRQTNSIILYPFESEPLLHVQLSVLDKPLISAHNVSHVTFAFLNLTATRGSAIQVVGGTDISFMHLNIFNIGNTAIVFGQGAIESPGDAVVGSIGGAVNDYWFQHFEWNRLGGTNHLVYRVRIYDTGTGGIILGGGNKTSLTAGCNRVVDSIIEWFSRLSTTYKPAVWIDGVGNSCSGNTFRNAAHSAVIIYGNAHIIEKNLISSVVQETVDASAIYTGRDWSSQGTIIRFNYIRNSGYSQASAVYLDDLASGMLIYSNVFENLPFGVQTGGGRSIAAINNLFIRCKLGFHMDDRGIKPSRWNSLNSVLFLRLNSVPYTEERWSSLFPSLAMLLEQQPQLPLFNEIANNYFCSTPKNRISQRDNHIQIANTIRLDPQMCLQEGKIRVEEMPGSSMDLERHALFKLQHISL